MKYFCLILLITSVAGRFSDDFYQLLAKDDANKNLISSPLSVEIAMAMIYIGAGGTTAQEMRDVLKMSADKEEVLRKYKELLTNIEKKGMLNVANRMYIEPEIFDHNPEYSQGIRDSFKTENITIEDSIIKRFKDIRMLVVALLNDVNFKDQWRYAFNSNDTKKADFRTADKQLLPVQMMSLSGTFKAAYVPDLDAKVIELPYRNSSLSMVVFLPEKVDGLPELEKKIVGFNGLLPSQNVNLKLPKFKITYTKDLTDTLKRVGVLLFSFVSPL
ncbi:hypothetical protein KR084_001785 [Drosophila pseudotakahashii]|nr:hypothetical protein KR084_001785 [Drosophila pseudotakahashii]